MRPPYVWSLPPERLVDGARASRGRERREWCTQLADSAEARAELDFIAAFEEDLDAAPIGRGLAERIEIAVEGVLDRLPPHDRRR